MSPQVMEGSGALYTYILYLYFCICYLVLYVLFILCLGMVKLYMKFQNFFHFLYLSRA